MTGSVRGALSNERPYRDRAHLIPFSILRIGARRAHAQTTPSPNRVGMAREIL